MKHIGQLKKMRNEYKDSKTPIQYFMRLGEQQVALNPVLQKEITLYFTGNINCIHCNRKMKKTFAQGYCFPCFQTLAETDMCIMKPELCHHHKGTCRDNEFAQKHCFIPHAVYLAFSSGVKVGITREHQKFTRWADQGAIAATQIAQVPDRKTAGFLEVEIAKHVTDKTNWRKMLSSIECDVDLLQKKQDIIKKLPKNYADFIVSDDIHQFIYPVVNYPDKISSYNLDKDPKIKDILLGIKGQYLIFPKKVINLRKYQGYEIEFSL